MKIYLRHNKGFTLIELLVVVAIIGILSSVVLSSLNSARKKAKDAAIKEEISQLANLMALNYNDYGSYCQLQSAGWTTLEAGTCDSMFSGNYATQARAICNNIYNNANDLFLPTYPVGSTRIFSATSVGCSSAYTFMVALNNGNWYCSGSSGRKGEYSGYWGQPGCYDNP